MITIDFIKSILDYDQDTGLFTWKIDPSPKVRRGMIAGRKMPDGYLIVKINNRDYSAHRLAWFYVNGEWPEKFLDHINRNRSDNRICNLRNATAQQNQFNRSIGKANTSGFLGVSWKKSQKKWVAYISVNYKKISLGSFDNPEEASIAYMKAKEKMHNF